MIEGQIIFAENNSRNHSVSRILNLNALLRSTTSSSSEVDVSQSMLLNLSLGSLYTQNNRKMYSEVVLVGSEELHTQVQKTEKCIASTPICLCSPRSHERCMSTLTSRVN